MAGKAAQPAGSGCVGSVDKPPLCHSSPASRPLPFQPSLPKGLSVAVSATRHGCPYYLEVKHFH